MLACCLAISGLFLAHPSINEYIVVFPSLEDDVEITLIGESDYESNGVEHEFETLMFSFYGSHVTHCHVTPFPWRSGWMLPPDMYRLPLSDIREEMTKILRRTGLGSLPRIPYIGEPQSAGIYFFDVYPAVGESGAFFSARWRVLHDGPMTLEVDGITQEVSNDTLMWNLGQSFEIGKHVAKLRLIGADGLIEEAVATFEVIEDCGEPEYEPEYFTVYSAEERFSDSMRLEYDIDGDISILPLAPQIFANRFRIYPGDWRHVFDELTFVWKGGPQKHAASSVWITQFDLHGEEMLTLRLANSPYPTQLYSAVIGGPNHGSLLAQVDNSYVEVFAPSGAQFCVIAIQGQGNLRWRNDVIPIEED